MASVLWIFWIYSFLGYVLEKVFAAAIRSPHRVRKCRLFLPLCPVYGLGMLTVLALPAVLRHGIAGGFCCGIAAAAVEYVVHWLYEAFLNIRFWDYSARLFHINGRVCLPFAVVWGMLTVTVAKLVHPMIAMLAERIPSEVTFLMLLVFVADTGCSFRFLSLTGNVDGLRTADYAILR